MTKLAWGSTGDKVFEAGIDRGVLYAGNNIGVPWNGLISVNENPTGGSPTPLYLDGLKFMNEPSPEEFEASISAYTYPVEFEACDGTLTQDDITFTQQQRQIFSLAYRSLMGNDVESLKYGYKIHLIYNALAKPTSVSRGSNTNVANLNTFNWGITTQAVAIPGLMPTAHVIIDSTKVSAGTLATIEDYLYGTDLVDPRILFPEDLIELMPWLYFKIVPNEVTGLAQLVLSDTTMDLRTTNVDGIYKRAPRSRLKETVTPGFFSLDV